MTAAIGAMCSAIRLASSSTTLPPSTSAGARPRTRRARRRAARAASGRPRRPGARPAPTLRRRTGRSRRCAPRRRGRPRRRRRSGRGGARRGGRARRRARCPPRGRRSPRPRRDAAPLLTECREVDVVVERDRQAEPLDEVGTEVAALEARDVRRHARAARSRRRPRRGRRQPRCPAGAPAVRTPRRATCEASRSPPAPSPPRRCGSSTSWRARTVPARSQIAPRRNLAPRSRPRTSAASGTGSKKTAPYRGRPGSASVSRTRPASRRDWSASETVGLEIPARREISAREIGAELRIVSRTVRSFRCFRSGGIAARVMSATLTERRAFWHLTLPDRTS